jgi:hypothetical protein
MSFSAVNIGMEAINSSWESLANNLTTEQRKEADAVAGGDFLKLLLELQAISSSFSTQKSSSNKGSLPEFQRPDDIMKVFYSDEIQAREPGSDPYFLEKKFPFLGPSVIKTIV